MEGIPHMKPPWDDGGGLDYSSPYQDLATAIVQLAVKDYKKTLRAIWKNPKSGTERRKLIAQKAELEEFFYSDYKKVKNIWDVRIKERKASTEGGLDLIL